MSPLPLLCACSSSVDPVAHDVAGLIGGFLIGRNASAQAAVDAASTLAPEVDYDVIMLLMVCHALHASWGKMARVDACTTRHAFAS